MLVDDAKIVEVFAEPGFSDNAEDDPFEVSGADTMLAALRRINAPA
jgi:peroxiredoxin